MAGMMKRYSELGLAAALTRAAGYPAACHELSLILRDAYAQLPKPLHSLLLRDTLSAFRLLPEIQTSLGLSAANLLLQAAESALPKQKKAIAVSEFKHAVVAFKRRSKSIQEGGSVQLPQDILLHIFTFLDLRSLVTASSVCWAWNAAANDNTLWQLQYAILFGLPATFCSRRGQNQTMHGADPKASHDWKTDFRRKYMGNPLWRFRSKRAVCGHCKSIIWLSNVMCDGSHHCCKLAKQQPKLRPLAPDKVVEYLLDTISSDSSSSDNNTDCDLQVVEFLLDEIMSDSSSSDSDADPDELTLSRQLLPRLWAYPKLASASDCLYAI